MKIIVAIDGFAASGKSTIAPLNLSVERRLEELKQQGNPATYQSVKNDLLERDKIDATWTHPAKDAIRIENGSIPLDDIIQNLLAIFYRLTES